MTEFEATATALHQLSDSLGRAQLRLDLADVETVRAVRVELSDQITDYLLPRIARIDAPLLSVLGGSTGSGKSTITNTLARAEVSPSGVLRPTTRAPVLICHPDDVDWFLQADVLPDLARVTGDDGTATGAVLRVRPVSTMQAGLAIIDAPDIDSVEEANRELATQLLAAADLWLFVTTAVRYADAVPWDFLSRAQERGTQLSIIINRVPPGAAVEIVPHLQSMLTERGLLGIDIHAVDEMTLTDDQLPEEAIATLRGRLDALAADADARADVVRATLDGALASIPSRARTVLDAITRQEAAADELRRGMENIVEGTKETVRRELSSGTLLRGEVLDRWQELIGTAELMRAVQSRISWLRDRIGAFIRGRTAATSEVQGEITSTLEQLLIDHADGSALDIVELWRQQAGGTQVLDDNRELERASSEFRSKLGGEIRAWQDDILDLVRERGAGKRTTARFLAFGVNSVGVALMIVLFSSTGGITGGEVAVASGTAAVSQGLLNALFGEQAVRDLADEARRLLLERVDTLLDVDANRFRTALWSAVPPPDAGQALRDALTAFDASRP